MEDQGKMEMEKERIIPITILSSRHHDEEQHNKSDENDNKGLSNPTSSSSAHIGKKQFLVQKVQIYNLNFRAKKICIFI